MNNKQKKFKKVASQTPVTHQTPTTITIIGRDVFVKLYNLRENPKEEKKSFGFINWQTFIGGQEEEEEKIKEKPIGVKVLAKVDTGAFSSSISKELAKKLGLHTEIPRGTKTIKSASGTTNREFFKVEMIIGTKRIVTEVNIADRSQLEYEMLLGRRDISTFQALVNVRKTEIKSKPVDAPSKNESTRHMKEFSKFAFENLGSPVPTVCGAVADNDSILGYKTEFDIVMRSAGSNRLRVISELKNLYEGFTWKDAKNIADNTPTTIAERVSKRKADELKDLFEFMGADIDIK